MRGGTSRERCPEIFYFPDSAGLGCAVARALAVPAHEVLLHRFPDRESLVRIPEPTRSRAVLVRQLHDPNPKLFEVRLAVDALRRAGVRRVGLLAPYLPYMRQDAVFHPGEPVSQRVLADCLGTCLDEIVTLEPHLHRTRRLADVFACRARALPAAPLLAAFCRRARTAPLLVGPDVESGPWVRAVAVQAGLPWVVCSKQRLGDRRVRIELPSLPRTRRALLIDDIASSGITLAAVARALRRAGVRRVDAAVVHAVFAPGALARIRQAGVSSVVSCDTIPHPSNGIATARYFAQALAGRPAER